MDLLKINGVVINNITNYSPVLSEQDGENSGRNPNLDMTRDILGRLLSINVTVGYMYQDKMQQLLQLLRIPNMQVECFIPELGNTATISCYCVDPQPVIKGWNPVVYESLDFQLVSNGRYD